MLRTAMVSSAVSVLVVTGVLVTVLTGRRRQRAAEAMGPRFEVLLQ